MPYRRLGLVLKERAYPAKKQPANEISRLRFTMLITRSFKRTYGWWERGENLYMKLYAEASFLLAVGELQIGDVIVMQV